MSKYNADLRLHQRMELWDHWETPDRIKRHLNKMGEEDQDSHKEVVHENVEESS